jgi:hypothetical protein
MQGLHVTDTSALPKQTTEQKLLCRHWAVMLEPRPFMFIIETTR